MSWEAFIIDQMISALHRVMPGKQAYFWRTAQGVEVDLLLDLGSRLLPFEIKLHSAPAVQDAESLRRCMHDLGLKRGYLIYPGEDSYSLGGGITVLSAEEVLSAPESLLRL
jgi:predicted AAA+ superfamily ATPase